MDDGDPVEDKALEAPIVIETTPMREGITLQFSQVFIAGLAFIRSTQEADMTARVAVVSCATRFQMAVSLGFHMVFAAPGIVPPLLMLMAEGLWLRTGQEDCG